MTDISDWQLLDAFAHTRDQAAFAQLVERHIGLVHGTARRTLGHASPHLDDVVQAVFLLLSQKARRIPRRGALPGWLFRATRFCCANVLKTERRRKLREREVRNTGWTQFTDQMVYRNLGLVRLGTKRYRGACAKA